ncbi:MAG TPA: hypothetical protein VND91_04140 [Candidatus Saccharimonadia bacterium]|nr:hypothetical protein [Candidatus Saccharimonadia bacterium]
MKALLDLLRDLMLFKRGPQDLPYSPAILAAACVFAFVVDTAVARQFQLADNVAARIAFSLAATLALPWLALKLADREARFAQTATALVATGAVFTLLMLPVLIGVGKMPEDPKQVTGTQALLALVSFAIVVWQLGVRGHILRHALDVPLRRGVLIAVVFYAVELVVAALVFGGGSRA